jgi:hypothetical protein
VVGGVDLLDRRGALTIGRDQQLEVVLVCRRLERLVHRDLAVLV